MRKAVDHSPRATFAASIIVPSYNEELRIGPLLATLSRVALELHYLVIVSCNGCNDRTPDIARSTPGLSVIDIAEAGKARALNEADRFASDVFPRLYVDADVQTDTDSLRLLVEALRVPEPRAVRPNVSYLVEGAPWLVRAYYSARMLIPSSRQWETQHIEGHSIYGTNESGRARFGEFPHIIADDAFFDRMFDPDEKVAVSGAQVAMPLPSSSRQLFHGLTRTYEGNSELTEWLEQHRPDRLFVDHNSPSPRRPFLDRLSHYAHGGTTFESWNPKTVIMVFARLSMVTLAKWNARRLRKASRRPDWR